MTDQTRIENENYLMIISSLTTLLEKEVTPNNLTPVNRYGLVDNDVNKIRSKIMECVDKIRI